MTTLNTIMPAQKASQFPDFWLLQYLGKPLPRMVKKLERAEKA